MGPLEEFLVGAAATVTASVISLAVINRLFRRVNKKPQRAARVGRAFRRIGSLFTQSIFGVLGVGLVWTVYFMVLGLADESRTEYAANAATLIVSVLTVFSIMIAFYEFMARGKEAPRDAEPDAPPQGPNAREAGGDEEDPPG